MAVPNIFGSATSAIPLSQLDQNFATAITLGNTAVYLGNTTTSLGNVTLTNVTISSGNVSISTATVGAGSNTAPSITTTGDTNTGIFFPAADTIAFATAGTEDARFDSAGNMGLGVTPSASWGGGKALVMTSGYVQAFTSTIFDIGSNAVYNGSSHLYAANGLSALYRQESGTHKWFNAASGTAGNTISFTQAMTLDASGRLGLGATSPNTKLELRTDTTSAGSEANLLFQNRSTGTSTYDVGGIFGAAYRDVRDPAFIAGINFVRNSFAGGLASGGSIVFYTDSSGGTLAELKTAERARIDSSGNLLVGDTSGSSRFKVVADGTNVNSEFYQPLTSSYTCIIFTNPNGTVGSITTTSAATTYATSSDYRLKENVAPMTGALAKVLELNPVTYTWKSDGSYGQGFIAHELQEVYPDAVSGEKDGEQMQGVDYGKLTPILTAALQEAIAKIETLEARIAVLEAK